MVAYSELAVVSERKLPVTDVRSSGVQVQPGPIPIAASAHVRQYKL
jgi:hypothetical protein